MARIVVAGYFVRYPLGGYAWCMAHYLLGLRALGHDAWFYEDTGYHDLAYDPGEGAVGTRYGSGVRAVGAFFDRVGFGDRWVFADLQRGREHGPAAGRADALLREADLLLNVGGSNHVAPERRGGRPALFVDLDPAYTQIKAASGDTVVRACSTPTRSTPQSARTSAPAGLPSRPPATAGIRRDRRWPAWWADAGPPGACWTTVGRWDEPTRDLAWAGRTYRWRKRTELLRCLDLPARTGARFEIAMDVDNVPHAVGVAVAVGHDDHRGRAAEAVQQGARADGLVVGMGRHHQRARFRGHSQRRDRRRAGRGRDAGGGEQRREDAGGACQIL